MSLRDDVLDPNPTPEEQAEFFERECTRLRNENATLQRQVEEYRAAVKPMREKFRNFLSSPYRGEWNQHLFNAGDVRDILAAMPGGRYDDALTKQIVGG